MTEKWGRRDAKFQINFFSLRVTFITDTNF